MVPRRLRGALSDTAISQSVRPSVCPTRSCLGCRHAGCLQLSNRWPPEMCGLWTRPRTNVDPPRFLDPWTDADLCIWKICGDAYCLVAHPLGDTLLTPAIRHPCDRHMARYMLHNNRLLIIIIIIGRLAGVSPLSQKTPGRQHSRSNAFQWLCKEEIRFLSTTPWSHSKLPLQP